MSLTKKQEAFALAYVKSTNASAAYREAYPAQKMSPESVHVAACRALKNAKVALRIKELAAPALEANEDEALRFLRENRRIALFDPRKLFDASGTLKPIHTLDDDTAAALSSFEVNEIREDGAVVGQVKKMKFWEKGAALDRHFKHLGLFERDNSQRSENLNLQIVLVKPGEAAGSAPVD